MQGHLILYILYIFLNNYTRYDTVQIMQSLLNFYIYTIFFHLLFIYIQEKLIFKKNLAKKLIHYLKFLEFLNCEPTSAKKLHYLRETMKNKIDLQ